MSSRLAPRRTPPEELERQDWRASLDEVLARAGPERARELLRDLQVHAQRRGVVLPVTSRTPYVNTIPPEAEPTYPGDPELERRIKSLVRWNAMAMVVRANREADGLGGHISTYASCATLYEVALHHFLRGREHASGGDHVYWQGHAAPGVYARAFLEGRMSAQDLERFRRELLPGGGLPSYPHPKLLPDFWEFPTVSMGLGPLSAIYRARFQRYLEDRGLVEPTDARVWCFVGDGECDEPETLGALSIAAREGLDNLVFVINCNLQRLDGPVRGNDQIVQELEAVFRGVGWHTVKVLWGSDWDELLAKDHDGKLARRMGEMIDGEAMKYVVEGGAYLREHFWGADPELLARVEHLSDDELWRLNLGGHDPLKVHAAYRAAVEHRGAPSVVLARTVKGYGLGEAGEGRNTTHQHKKLDEEELLHFRDRFDVPIDDAEVGSAPFYRPPEDSPEVQYLLDRRRELGGFVPDRRSVLARPRPPRPKVPAKPFQAYLESSGEREVTTTAAFVRLFAKLLRVEGLGPRLVPIVPDEARTLGLDALFRQVGIYSSKGQLYDPVDSEHLLYYREARDGQLLEEGITEAGSMGSFTAAGTGELHGVDTVPVFFFYSMFGMQRVGDSVWAAADSCAKGFLVGGTAGRTTLAGEGLQHADGHSHLLASAVPGLEAWDPAYAYEVAVIFEDGLRRMVEDDEDLLVYLTLTNEPYPMPALPEGAREGVLSGAYRVRPSRRAPDAPQATLLGSGALLREALAAADLLEDAFEVATEVWSVPSWTRLHADGLAAERWNRLHPAEEAREPHLARCFAGSSGVFVAVHDYVQSLPGAAARWLPGPLVTLGTDGFGRSGTRPELRAYFEVDAAHVASAAISARARAGELPAADAQRALTALGVDPEQLDPARAHPVLPANGRNDSPR